MFSLLTSGSSCSSSSSSSLGCFLGADFNIGVFFFTSTIGFDVCCCTFLETAELKSNYFISLITGVFYLLDIKLYVYKVPF